MNLAKILIVDNERDNLLLMAQVIENAGCGITRTVLDTREAVRICRQFEPDLVLIDLQARDGFSITRQIHETLSFDKAPMIFAFSADQSSKTRRRALGEGAQDFLSKPLDRIEFLLRCRNLLHTRFLQQQLLEKITLLQGVLQPAQRGNFEGNSSFHWAFT